MKVLYVLTGSFSSEAAVGRDLAGLNPALDVHTAIGAAAALVEIRAGNDYRAVFLSPHLPHGESLALVATLRRDRAPVAIVAIVTEADGDFVAPAITAGADDVLVMRDTGGFVPGEPLQRVRESVRLAGTTATRDEAVPELQVERAAPVAPVVAEHLYLDLLEAQKFERALRERDRAEMSRLRAALTEERERRIVLENTLRHTEDANGVIRRELEDRFAKSADRLHKVADQTQQLQNQLETEIAAQRAERERFINSDLFAYATVTVEGAVVRCNDAFARMFGFDSPSDAVAMLSSSQNLADHAYVVERLQAGENISRVDSVLRRADGRTFHALTSAAWLPESGGQRLIERILVDMDERTRVEEQLRIARRLEAAGRLAAEMASEIEPLLRSMEQAEPPDAVRSRASMLVRQMLAFSRRQAKPAGLLSLYDAIRHAEPLLRQIAGDGVSFDFRLAEVGTVAAGDDDIEQLLAGLVFAAASSLPYGGTLTVETRVARSGFDQRTELLVSAAGYGVHSALLSVSLARLVTRCGGVVRVTDEPARSTTLHVHLPT